MAELVSKHFPGATISEGIGVWKGKTEKSARIEIVTESKDLPAFKALANDIKRVNHQMEVLMTETLVQKLWLFVKPIKPTEKRGLDQSMTVRIEKLSPRIQSHSG